MASVPSDYKTHRNWEPDKVAFGAAGVAFEQVKQHTEVHVCVKYIVNRGRPEQGHPQSLAQKMHFFAMDRPFGIIQLQSQISPQPLLVPRAAHASLVLPRPSFA
jgi:hypothetical protein